MCCAAWPRHLPPTPTPRQKKMEGLLGQRSYRVLRMQGRAVTNLTPTCALIHFDKTTKHMQIEKLHQSKIKRAEALKAKQLLCWDSALRVKLSSSCIPPEKECLPHWVPGFGLLLTFSITWPWKCWIIPVILKPLQLAARLGGAGIGKEISEVSVGRLWATGSFVQLQDSLPTLPNWWELWIFQWLPRCSRWHILGFKGGVNHWINLDQNKTADWWEFADKNFPSTALSWLLQYTVPWFRQWRTCLQCRRPRFNPWVRKIPWRRKWQPSPVFLPGESHGQRSLAGYMGLQRVGHDWATNTLNFLTFKTADWKEFAERKFFLPCNLLAIAAYSALR